MTSTQNSRWSTAVLVAFALCVGLFLAERPAASQSKAPSTTWEYKSIQIEANELPAKLTTLGNDGWEVFSIERAVSNVETEDGNPKLVAVKYDVSAKKPGTR